MKVNWPLFALAIGAFGIGVTEFTPMGILPMIAADLKVSIPTAGLLVSAYAMGVLVGAPVMTLGLARVPRRALLIGLMAVFTVGNLLAALSGSYAMLFVARIITSFCHGAYFGVGSVVAMSVVAPDRRARAVATMFSGLTIATIGGVPMAAWVGAMFGWRAAFWGITAVGVIAMIALRAALPPLPVKGDVDIRAEVRVIGRGPVLSALALTVIGSSVMFTVFTYIVPILKNATGVSQGFVTAMLVVYGVGLTVGNLVGGRFADRSVDGTIIAALTASMVLLIAFALGMHSPFAAAPLIFLWGVASFAVVAPLQTRVMDKAHDAPNLASALNIGAFNLGNAIGAALGGAVIDAKLGYPMIPVAGAVMAGAGLVLLMVLRQVHPAKPAAA